MCKKCCDCLKWVQRKSSDKVMLVINFFAIALMLALIVLRIFFYHHDKQNQVSTTYNQS